MWQRTLLRFYHLIRSRLVFHLGFFFKAFNLYRRHCSSYTGTHCALSLSLCNISLFMEKELNHLPPWQPNPSWCCAAQQRSLRYWTPWEIHPRCFSGSLPFIYSSCVCLFYSGCCSGSSFPVIHAPSLLLAHAWLLSWLVCWPFWIAWLCLNQDVINFTSLKSISVTKDKQKFSDLVGVFRFVSQGFMCWQDICLNLSKSH